MLQAKAQNLVILCTASLIPAQFEQRKKEYIEALKQLPQLAVPFYVVENHLVGGPSFLDDYCSNVFYFACNNINLRNKGVNEAISMLKALELLNLNDETMVIKLTGRYQLRHFALFKLIKENPDCDAFVKYDSYGQVYTGCYAMRYHCMKKMVQEMDLHRMEVEMISIEKVVADFIHNNINAKKIYILQDLGIMAHFFGDGSQITSMEL